MRVLMVDNGGPRGVLTPRLKCMLSGLADVAVCATRREAKLACDAEWDAIVLSGSDEGVSGRVCTASASKNTMLMLRFGETPMLGVCFGMQIIAAAYGGKVGKRKSGGEKVGMAPVRCDEEGWLGLPAREKGEEDVAFFSHWDVVRELPPRFRATAWCGSELAGMADASNLRLGVQFHPEASPPCFRRTVEAFLALAASRFPPGRRSVVSVAGASRKGTRATEEEGLPRGRGCSPQPRRAGRRFPPAPQSPSTGLQR